MLAVLASTTSAPQRASRKLIATGWDSPTSAEFRKHASEFEKWPFDGVTIFPTIKRADGGRAMGSYRASMRQCRYPVSLIQKGPQMANFASELLRLTLFGS